MITISLCMIVKNEEDVLDNCLSSIYDIVDEIIIVDTGSTDKTKEIAKRFNCKIFDFQWINDFSAARNFSFSKASKDFILWLDADDVLLSKDREKLKKLKNTMDNSVDSYSMIYHYAFDEYGNVILNFRRNRLVKRKNNFQWHDVVHEYISVNGKVVDTDICITHKRVHDSGERNLNIYREYLEKEKKLNTRDIYYFAKELFDHAKYEEGLQYFLAFLEKKDGWIEDKLVACLKIADYYFSIGDFIKSRKYCLMCFEYTLPRAEACCRLGLSYLKENKIKEAVFWYKLVTNLDKPIDDWSYTDPSAWTWLPQLQLCICYYRLGDKDKSYKHNEKAGKYNPNHESILYNKSFFKSLGYEN